MACSGYFRFFACRFRLVSCRSSCIKTNEKIRIEKRHFFFFSLFFASAKHLCFSVVVVAISLVSFYGLEEAVPLVQTGKAFLFIRHYHDDYFCVYFDLENRAASKTALRMLQFTC